MAMHFEKEKMSIMHFKFIFVEWVKFRPRETFYQFIFLLYHIELNQVMIIIYSL